MIGFNIRYATLRKIVLHMVIESKKNEMIDEYVNNNPYICLSKAKTVKHDVTTKLEIRTINSIENDEFVFI